MKGLIKGLFVLALLGGLGYAIYHFFFSSPSQRACTRVAKLCGKDASAGALKKCEDLFVRLKKASGKESMQRAEACIDKSETCPAAIGCVVGAGLGAAGEFLDGVKRAIENGKKAGGK